MSSLEQLYAWINAIKSANFFYWWALPILFLLVFAILIIIRAMMIIWKDTYSIISASKMEEDCIPAREAHIKFKGIVKIWTDLIIGRASKGHPSGANELELIIHNRYTFVDQWLDWIRSSCTTVGLFFTFFGLGLALKDLGDALQLSAGISESNELANLLIKVREVLPTMGTAFASSIAGIGVSFLIGIFENLLNAARNDIPTDLSDLSMRWLEPELLPSNDMNALIGITEAIKKTQKDMERSAELHQEAMENMRNLSKQFELFPKTTQDALKYLLDEIKIWAKESTIDVKKTLDTMNVSWVELSDELTQLYREGHNNSQDYVNTFNKLSKNLSESSKSLSEFLSNMVGDLKIGATQIQELSTAIETFKDAQIDSNQIIHESHLIQTQMSKALEQTFEKIPLMAQLITEAAYKTESSTDKMHKVILNSDIEKYLTRINSLNELAKSEEQSRREMHKVFEELKLFGSNVSDLNINIQKIGQTTNALERAHSRMETQLEKISNGSIMPVFEEIVNLSVVQSSQNYGSIVQKVLENISRHIQSESSQIEILANSQIKQEKLQIELKDILRKIVENKVEPQKNKNFTYIIFISLFMTILSITLLTWGPLASLIQEQHQTLKLLQHQNTQIPFKNTPMIDYKDMQIWIHTPLNLQNHNITNTKSYNFHQSKDDTSSNIKEK